MGTTRARTPSTKVLRKDRFGHRAIKLGFCTQSDVDKALQVQEQLRQEKKAHKLIGLVLLEMGAISTDQLIRVLRTYEDEVHLP